MANKGFIERDGFQLGYVIEGQGAPALIIGSAQYYPRVFSENLRKHLQLIFIDHRGFVKSSQQESKQITLATILEDIAFMKEQLVQGPCIIIGHSGHGYMALEFAKKYPEHAAKIVLIGMGPNQSHQSHHEAQQYFDNSVCPDRKKVFELTCETLPQAIEQFPEKRFITFCIKFAARSWYDYSIDRSSLWDGVHCNMPIIDQLWGKEFCDIDITRGLDAFDKPVLLALGKFDYLVAPFYSWIPLLAKFKNITLKLFEKSGHTPPLEETELFDQVLLDWVK